jgi:hypothetical protein
MKFRRGEKKASNWERNRQIGDKTGIIEVICTKNLTNWLIIQSDATKSVIIPEMMI